MESSENTKSEKKQALRYNAGKPRLSLIDAYFLLQLGEVLTRGAIKYPGKENWRTGLPWMEVLDSLERHVREFKDMDESDYDKETKLHHMAHVACNAMFLIWYSKYRREFDDRYKDKKD